MDTEQIDQTEELTDGIDDVKEPTPEEVYDADDGSQEEETPDEEKEPASEQKEQENEHDQVDDEQKDTNEIPDELAKKAKDAGLSDDDIKDFSPSQLEKVVSLMPKKEVAEDKEEKSEEQPKADDEFKIELDEDLYDPDICKAMKSTAEQINALKSQLNEVSAGYKQSQVANAERQFESMVNSLDDNFNDLLGKGSVHDIGSDSEQFTNRCKVMEEMNAIASGYESTGKQLPKPQELFERAVNAVFGDSIKTNTRKSLASQLKKRSSNILNRSSSKAKSGLSPEAAARAAVKQKMREYGHDSESEFEDEF